MTADPTKKLRVALIYSYGANEEEAEGILDEENSDDTSALDLPQEIITYFMDLIRSNNGK